MRPTHYIEAMERARWQAARLLAPGWQAISADALCYGREAGLLASVHRAQPPRDLMRYLDRQLAR